MYTDLNVASCNKGVGSHVRDFLVSEKRFEGLNRWTLLRASRMDLMNIPPIESTYTGTYDDPSLEISNNPITKRTKYYFKFIEYVYAAIVQFGA